MPRKGRLLVIAVTGTPAAGKTSFAKDLAAATGITPIEVNDIVERDKLFSGVDQNGSKIVKMEELVREIEDIENAEKASGRKAVILVGHLLADLKLGYDISVIVRSNLKDLVSRLEERDYQREKVRENLVSESIDYCGVQAAEKSKETYEVETDAQKSEVADYIKDVLSGKKASAPKLPAINKMDEMLELVYEGNDYGL